MSNELQQHPLPELVREIKSDGSSGALRLWHDRIKAVIYFDSGRIVFASSNIRVHRLSELLRKWGAVSRSTLESMVTEGMSDDELRSVLVSSNVMTEGDFSECRAQQASEIIRLLLTWTEGSWEFDARARLAKGEFSPIDDTRLLLEGARSLPAELTASRWKSDDEVISCATGIPPDVPLLPVEAFVMSRIEGPARLGELVSLSGLSETQARHTAYILAVSGLVVRESWPRVLDKRDLQAQTTVTSKRKSVAATPSRQSNQAPDNGAGMSNPEAARTQGRDLRAEIDELMRYADAATHYEVLGVSRNADAGTIKSAYLRLVKRFHPDRFQAEVDQEHLSRVQAAFARISRAYEVLRDLSKRASYDASLGLGSGTSPRGAKAQQEASTAPRNDKQIRQVSDSLRRAESFFQKAQAAEKKRDHRRALEMIGEAARLAPEHAEYRAWYGRALAREPGTRRQAEAELIKAINLEPGNAGYHLDLAKLYLESGFMARADAAVQRVLSIDPQHPGAHTILDKLLLKPKMK